jgi:hypothetical protein
MLDDTGIDHALDRLAWLLLNAGYTCRPMDLERQEATIALPFDNGDRIVITPGEQGVEAWISRLDRPTGNQPIIASVTMPLDAHPDYMAETVKRMYVGSLDLGD